MTSEEQQRLWNLRFALLYRCELSVLYHRKRERFFELCDKFCKGISLLGASAVTVKATALSSEIDLALWGGLLVTFVSTAALVLSFSDRARRHSDLASKAGSIISSVVVAGECDLVEKDINLWRGQLSQLESTEPHTLSVLVVLCQNEIAIASGQMDKVCPQPFYKRLLAHLIDFSISTKPESKSATNQQCVS